MKRLLIPGRMDRHGVAHPLPHCAGNCNQGRAACNCATGCMEMDCDVAPDAERVIQPPAPLSDELRARLKRRALYLSALGFGVLAGLLEAFGATSFKWILP